MALLHPTRLRNAQPAWDIALLYPQQGCWTEDDYLELTASTNRMVELCDGKLEVLPTPKTSHQLIARFLFLSFVEFVGRRKSGTVLFAPLRVRIWEGAMREPDIVFMLRKNAKRMGEDFWDEADLALEVVSGSEKDRKRDLIKKKREYGKAGITEYWIVDPKQRQIVVLKLRQNSYVIHSKAVETGIVESALLAGFSVKMEDVMDEREEP